ncbi:unnamed protein product [Arabis nemorensis]|uniref:Phosphoglycerate mutase-like protein n=1 Tax=Arabis nemorensis TaxID=586526 RepID=A0A565AYH7_9BRAS|nr:unnamed protein product [Arabis nemorensis]
MAVEQGVYPLGRCKTIHLVRHGEGTHNAAADEVPNREDVPAVFFLEDYFDAELTDDGWSQVDQRRMSVREDGIFGGVELVVVSPLLRTLQTAVGIFGGEGDVGESPPLMIEGAGNSNRPAISNLNCKPFVAHELCREGMELHPCDRRRNKTYYVSLFPAVDFSLITDEEDVLWNPERAETAQEIAARGVRFLKWLFTRPEKEIAVVSHGVFFYYTLGLFQNECDEAVKRQFSGRFHNCELRSFVVVEKFINNLEENLQNNGAGEE